MKTKIDAGRTSVECPLGDDEDITKKIHQKIIEALIEYRQYQYKDKVSRGSREVFGFLAQEIEDVLPECVDKRTEPIPNILELADVSESNVITFSRFDTSNLVVSYVWLVYSEVQAWCWCSQE